MILLVTGCRAIARLMAPEARPRPADPEACPSRNTSVSNLKPGPTGPG